MSQILIQQYLNELSSLRQVSGTGRESVVSEAFKDLLKAYGRQHDLVFVPQFEVAGPGRERRYVDGALLYSIRIPFGYWEAKDERDDLDAEIELKFKRGYPQDNIIFEDSRQAVLIQDGAEITRCSVDDVAGLQALLDRFFRYERREIAEFRKAIEQFKSDLPTVLAALRDMIEQAERKNDAFEKAAEQFLQLARKMINPSLTELDIREMLIQHILTEEVFSAVFPGTSFHRDNNVARDLYALEATFFTGNTKWKTLKSLERYYAAIRRTAAAIESHVEKQKFLRVVYENFYRVYNPKAADRLGVIYTPSEIVRFMVEGADWLCEQHFGRSLIDRDVDILDPATGTGTFICELLEHFRGQKLKLAYKYRHELHANEVAILPYYVANLNIEATRAAIMGDYEEFPGLCFVDTLDNTFALRKYAGHQEELFGISDVNVARIRKQNARRISVIIGNPPYRANQLNENDDNKNRPYPEIDGRIKETYVAASAAQKTKSYDMYTRFFRWASDRLDENGIIAFVSNNSFIDSLSMDGFRRSLMSDFNEIRIIDLKGMARAAGERRRAEGGNVFGNQIRVGIAVWFCVRRKGRKGCRIFYEAVRDFAKADEKLDFLTGAPLAERRFEEVRPDAKGNWINLTENDYESLVPIATKAVKARAGGAGTGAIFARYSLGISTNRDEWLYDRSESVLRRKVKCLIEGYEAHRPEDIRFQPVIKWSETLKRRARAELREKFDPRLIRRAAYRPFCALNLYQSMLFIDRPGAAGMMFPPGAENIALCFSDVGSRTGYVTLAVAGIADLHFGASVDAFQQVALYRFDEDGERRDNITDWALNRFRKHYGARSRKARRSIDKESIFHYVYGVLHDPAYRETYAQNLKREFPRIPLHPDFWQWADWGKTLLGLHIGYESVPPFALERIEVRDDAARRAGMPRKVLLRSEKTAGRILVDSETTLARIPASAWRYQLGNLCAIDWILDQYKESAPSDPIIRERFNEYRFAEHKEEVIELLARVTTVSVETVRVLDAMREARRD